MKNAATGIGLAVLGLGIAVNGLNLNGNQANATPAAFNAGPVEPTIVWYGSVAPWTDTSVMMSRVAILRAWSDGTIEARHWEHDLWSSGACGEFSTCDPSWHVLSSPREGLNAAADINFDERVDAADLGQLLAAWGDAPRNDSPPSDCPLGVIP